MADANINELSTGKVRKSFVITVDVDESRSMTDVKFISTSIGKEAVLDALMNDPSEVFFEGQEELAARWMSMGNGSLPLHLLDMVGVDVAPAPADDVTQALNILDTLFSNGTLDNLQSDEAYTALREMEDRLMRAEKVLRAH